MKRASLKYFCLLAVATLWLPRVVFASPILSEIMYDLASGSDSGREWIEIENVGTSSVTLSSYKLFESGTNHDIKFTSGKSSLAVGEYAVIASNPKKFLGDNPSFSGNLFDSLFSLSNSGESIVLRDSALKDVDTLTYSSSQGASGNGNSLQRNKSNAWVENLPTPGSVNVEVALAPAVPKKETTQVPSTHVTAPRTNVAVTRKSSIRNLATPTEVLTGTPAPVLNSVKLVSNSLPEKSSNLTIWIVGLVMLIGVAILGFILVNQLPKEVPKVVDEADTYEIIE